MLITTAVMLTMTNTRRKFYTHSLGVAPVHGVTKLVHKITITASNLFSTPSIGFVFAVDDLLCLIYAIPYHNYAEHLTCGHIVPSVLLGRL